MVVAAGVGETKGVAWASTDIPKTAARNALKPLTKNHFRRAFLQFMERIIHLKEGSGQFPNYFGSTNSGSIR